jgi:putative acetyltransferase
MKAFVYQVISPLRDDVRALMDRLNKHNLSHCPPEICHLATPEQLATTDCIMFGAFIEGCLCGMGAIKFMTGYGEITRMFVADEFRGRGVAKEILGCLIQCAVDRGLASVKLETSTKFISAVRLYKASGFTLCPPFGEYVNSSHNTYMEKKLPTA